LIADVQRRRGLLAARSLLLSHSGGLFFGTVFVLLRPMINLSKVLYQRLFVDFPGPTDGSGKIATHTHTRISRPLLLSSENIFEWLFRAAPLTDSAGFSFHKEPPAVNDDSWCRKPVNGRLFYYYGGAEQQQSTHRRQYMPLFLGVVFLSYHQMGQEKVSMARYHQMVTQRTALHKHRRHPSWWANNRMTSWREALLLGGVKWYPYYWRTNPTLVHQTTQATTFCNNNVGHMSWMAVLTCTSFAKQSKKGGGRFLSCRRKQVASSSSEAAGVKRVVAAAAPSLDSASHDRRQRN
jgi:hypothetical protein